MTSTANYQFVVQNCEDKWYPLDFKQHDDRSDKYLAGVWQRLASAVEKDCILRDAKAADWVQWKPWQWCGARKAGYDGRVAWMAWLGDQMVGFLNVWRDYSSQHESGRYVLYIEHLAAFPGDQHTELWRRRYRHVGKALLAFAIDLSDKAGFGGRVGLHSENDVSLEFYRKVAAGREVTLFHPEKNGVVGPTPHGQHSDSELIYLETTSDGAMGFLGDYRNG